MIQFVYNGDGTKVVGVINFKVSDIVYEHYYRVIGPNPI